MIQVVAEIYKTARGQPVELSLRETLEARKQAELHIYNEVNRIQELGMTDMIAMMIPLVVAPLKQPGYFNELFGGSAALTHAEAFTKKGVPEFADTQRLLQALFGTNDRQKFLFSLKEDPNSPVGLTVNKVLLLINSDDLGGNVKHELTRVLESMGIPRGYSVSELFTDSLEYTSESLNFEQTLASNLLNTYILTTLAASDPKVFTGEFNYKLSKQTGRSTYMPDAGEVLFEVTQPSEAPASWFEIFDKAGDDDFDLNAELTHHINGNLLNLAKAG